MRKHISRILFCLLALLPVHTARAQEITIRTMTWNVANLSKEDLSGERAGYPIDDFVTIIRNTGAEIIAFQEFGSGLDRLNYREVCAEFGAALGMYSYYIHSYESGSGWQGNGIISKYPIVAAGSMSFDFPNDGEHSTAEDTERYGRDHRSCGYIDIAVPVSDSESRIVRIGNTHMDLWIGLEGHQKQAFDYATMMSMQHPVYPGVMLGDYNGSGDDLEEIWKWGEEQGSGNIDKTITFPKGGWEMVKEDYYSPTLDKKVYLSDHGAEVRTLKLK